MAALWRKLVDRRMLASQCTAYTGDRRTCARGLRRTRYFSRKVFSLAYFIECNGSAGPLSHLAVRPPLAVCVPGDWCSSRVLLAIVVRLVRHGADCLVAI